MIVGTVLKIMRANENMTIFTLEDPTGCQIVEVFKDKIPFGKNIEVGQKWQVKGEFTLNYFKEKILKGFKTR
jgi:hypothetical protein